MNSYIKNVFGSLAALLLLSACCSSTSVILLPDGNNDSQITVSSAGGERVLSEAGAMLTVGSSSHSAGEIKRVPLEEVEKKHASLFAIQPEQVLTYILYFEHDATRLLPESKALLPTIISAAKKRKSPQFNVIGHTDAVGDSHYNFNLSMARAKTVLGLLKKAAIEHASFHVDSHGENDPLIVSGREREPKNRRVEIQIW